MAQESSRHERSRTLWPLPGGSGHYLDTLNSLLDTLASTTDTDEVLDVLQQRHGVQSRKAAASYLRVLNTLDVAEVVGQHTYITDEGAAYRDDGDTDRILGLLLGRVAGCAEVLEVLRSRPLRSGQIAERLADLGYAWGTQSQLRYRLRWLEELGVVERFGTTRPEYALTHRARRWG